MAKSINLTVLLLSLSLAIFSQEKSNSGRLSLGSRSTLSFFNHHGGTMGVGMGGQFRLQLADRVNTEWFMDNFNSQQDGIIGRKDLHIGVSVFYYYLENNSTTSKIMQPFFEVGYCFDYTNVNEIGTDNFAERWSSAVQFGVGNSFNLTERFDVTTKVQYMIHLGGDIGSTISEDGHTGHNHVEITKHQGVDLEGHLLFSLSLNYRIGNIWNRK